MKIKKTSIPIYGGDLALILTDDVDELRKYLPDHHIEPECIYGHAVMHGGRGIKGKISGKRWSRQTYSIILNFNHDTSRVTHGTIIHEVEHVKNMLFSARDIETNPDDDETQAYFMEWVTNQIYLWLDKLDMVDKIHVKRSD